MKVERMTKGDWGKVKAFFNVETSEGFAMRGFKLVEGINGLFVGFPSQKDKEGEYRDTIFANKDLKMKLNELAIKEFNGNSNTSVSKVESLDDIPF